MTRENDLKLVGKGSKKLIRNSITRGLINHYLEACKLKVVIEEIWGSKGNVLVNADAMVEGKYREDDVVDRFKNASDMFRFLQGYYRCLENLSK